MTSDNQKPLITVAIILVTVAIVFVAGLQFITAGQSNFQEWYNNSEKWCNDQNGEFEETIAGGPYSGLECTLESGKTVDMGEVAYQDYPEETDDLPKLENTPYRGAIWNQLDQLLPATAILLGILAITLGYARVRAYMSDTDHGESEE